MRHVIGDEEVHKILEQLDDRFRKRITAKMHDFCSVTIVSGKPYGVIFSREVNIVAR
jgi:hypothetical protein